MTLSCLFNIKLPSNNFGASLEVYFNDILFNNISYDLTYNDVLPNGLI